MLRTKFRRIATGLTLAATLFIAAGCSNDNIVIPDTETGAAGAPQLPAMSTMRLDLDFFGVETPVADQVSLDKGTPSQPMLAEGGGDHENWINAFVRAIFIQLTVLDHLEEPIGAFAYAVHSVPQEVEPGVYLWTYIFVDGPIEYSVFLYGTPVAAQVQWRMEVSSNNPEQILDHFVWFDGRTNNDESGGYWQFYEPTDESNGIASVRIDWSNGPLQNQLIIAVNGIGHEDEGDTVTFTETPTSGAIDFYDAGLAEQSNISWRADGTGSITVPDYNDGNIACWDQEQRNTVCP